MVSEYDSGESEQNNDKEYRDIVAAIPVFEDMRVVFVKSKKGKWIFPKGGVKHGELPPHAARREAFEEAGVIGEVELLPLCIVRNIRFYVLEVFDMSKTYDEAEKRERRVMTPEEALNNEELADYVKDALIMLIKCRLTVVDEFDIDRF